MKNIFRTTTFVFITINFVLKAFPFVTFEDSKTFALFLLLLTLLFLFKGYLLDMLSLPVKGPGYWIISFILTLIVINLFLALFSGTLINTTTTPDLKILGIVIPSLALNGFMSNVAGALFISTIMSYFEWLCRKK